MSTRTTAGFSLLEAMLASTVFILIVTALSGAIIYGQQGIQLAGQRSRAAFLAEEGIEAVQNMSDADFGNLVNGTYGLALQAGVWSFSGASDTTGIYTRTIQVATVDTNTKQVTSTVTWEQNQQRSGTMSAVTYFTNWEAPVGVGDWTLPTREGWVDIGGGQDGIKVHTEGNYAYMVMDSASGSFAVVDVTDTLNPVLHSSINLQDNPKNIAVSGNYAYVSSKNNQQELQVVDISNPASPSLVGSYNLTGAEDAVGIFVVGNYVYLSRMSGSQPEFYVLNVSTPTAPSLTGTTELGFNGNEVTLLGNYAYVATADDAKELQVIDISNPAVPTAVTSYNLSNSSDGLSTASFGTSVVLGRADGYVHIFDVSNPAAPILSGSFNASGSVNDVALGVNNTYLFLATANANNEFQLLDISLPSTPTIIGTLNIDDVLNGVTYHPEKDRAFAVGNSNTQEFVIMRPQ